MSSERILKGNVSAAYSELEMKGYAVVNHGHHSGEFQILCDGAYPDKKGVGDTIKEATLETRKLTTLELIKKSETF